jgi:hypothetical protein
LPHRSDQSDSSSPVFDDVGTEHAVAIAKHGAQITQQTQPERQGLVVVAVELDVPAGVAGPFRPVPAGGVGHREQGLPYFGAPVAHTLRHRWPGGEKRVDIVFGPRFDALP